MTIGLSIKGCSHSKNPVWGEKRRLTGPEIGAAATSKVWRESGRASFHSSLKKTKEAPLAGCRQFSYSEKTSEKYFHTCISSSNRENSYQTGLILLEVITQILSNPCWCAAVNANVTVLLWKWRKIYNKYEVPSSSVCKIGVKRKSTNLERVHNLLFVQGNCKWRLTCFCDGQTQETCGRFQAGLKCTPW